MACSSARKRVRCTFDVHFGTTEDKDRFVERLKHVRKLLSQLGNPCADNHSFMSALFDAVDKPVSQPTFDPASAPHAKFFLRNSGMDYFKSLCAGMKCNKAGIQIFFSHQASTRRKLPLLTATPCSSLSDTASTIF